MRFIFGMLAGGLIYTALPGMWQARVEGWFEQAWTLITGFIG